MKNAILKPLFLVFIILIYCNNIYAQKKVYNPKADSKKELNTAITTAKKEGKHVFIKIGGNWCSWCLLFHKYTLENKNVNKVLHDNYIEILISARENKELLKKLGNPGRFGYPVFVILDATGKRIHTQDSGLLESGKGYDEQKVTNFLLNWSPKVLNKK